MKFWPTDLLASLVTASLYSIPSGRVKTPRDPINWPSRVSEIRRIRRRLKRVHGFGDTLLPVFGRETGSPILLTTCYFLQLSH